MFKLIGIVLAILVFTSVVALTLLYSAISWGVVLWCFWDWFLLPVFPMLTTLTFWKAFGLMFFIDLFKNQIYPPAPEFKKEFIVKDGKENHKYEMLINPWVILFLGFLSHLFIGFVS